MSRWPGLLLGAFLAAGAGPQDPGAPVVLEQIISRENPAFRAEASLAAGRDGRVYLTSGSGDASYVLRLNRDGTGKRGAPVVYAAANATANRDGLIATANGHFAHKVALYEADFSSRAGADDFLVSDQVGWDAPAHVEAGESGDFYGVDQHRDRIVRISPAGKVLKAYPLPREPEGHPGLVEDFRVSETTDTFYAFSRSGDLRAIGFDGKKRWAVPIGHVPFDVSEDGTVFVLDRHGDTIRAFDRAGKPSGGPKLDLGPRRPDEHGWAALRVVAGDVLVKRRHPTELFQRYDLATGAFRNAVEMEHERLTVTFARPVWTAGRAVPLRVEFSGGAAPAWRVWARPLHVSDWREFPFRDGAVRPPDDAAGLYQVKVTPEIAGGRGRFAEYLVQTVVEIRRPGSKGTAAVMTPENRVHFARGEEIPFRVLVRAADEDRPASPDVRLTGSGREFFRTNEARGALPKSLTAALPPGSYALTVSAPGLTGVPQPLILGPGRGRASIHTIQYGDYEPLYPSAGVWQAADAVAAHADRADRLGVNLFVDRLGSHLQTAAVSWDSDSRAAAEALARRLAEDPRGVAPEKATGLPPLQELLAAYGARGIDQMAILMNNDAGLPLGGPGFDGRTPEELVRALTDVTQALKAYPAFRGWSWSSNWWVFEKRGAAAARNPEEKKAYEAALRRARETGAWDAVLDAVAGVRLGFAVEAQDLFNRTLKALAPGLVTASACPHRNVESYPPVSFSNVDECDLQAQWEQIGLPYHVPHGVDFYRRPGKRAWTHPEVWNDSGTGDQVLPTLLSALQRGADGIGVSGSLPPWMGGEGLPHDARSSHYGTLSVFRALNRLLHRYGPWWNAMEPHDPVAIVVSKRMCLTDEWKHTTGEYFARLWEAYASCLHAHYPATHVFAEDLKPGTLRRFKIVLVVGQRVEMEPALAEALRAARQAGVAVFHDGTCRPELVKEFRPLGTSFDRFEKDAHPASDDHAYWRFPAYCRSHRPALRQAFAPVAPPVLELENPEVFVAERRFEDGRYFFLVNQTTPDLEPGQLWRVTLNVATRVPVRERVALPAGGAAYDAFALRRVDLPNVTADLRSLPGRIFAVLPHPIGDVELRAPAAARPGEAVAWTAAVRDPAGRPLRAGVPLRVRLLGPDGAVLEERFTWAGSKGARGTFVAALPGGRHVLEACELLSARAAAADIAVGEPPAPGTPPPPRTPAFPTEDDFGPRVRDVAVLEGGSMAVLNAMNWDDNLYAVDLETGRLRWRSRVGRYFAFAPRALRKGFAVQGFRFDTAEGYHLYLADAEGRPERAFALPGLPKRLPHRFVPGILSDRINQFAVPDDARWVAGCGDLGLAVWSRDGTLLWSHDRSKVRRPALLAAADASTLVVVDGMNASALEAGTGRRLWEVSLAPTGEARDVRCSRDGTTVAVLTTTEGGRVFLLRGGRVAASYPTGGTNAFDLSADGAGVAVAASSLLKFYSVDHGLRWVLPGDDLIRFPRVAPDGKRVVATTDLGTLYVADVEGRLLLERDLGACAAPAWLPGGDLLVAGWMGRVSRLDGSFRERWTTRLEPAAEPAKPEAVPAARPARWTTSEAAPAPIAPNLLRESGVIVRLVTQTGSGGEAWRTGPLFDGKADPPAEPWIPWSSVGWMAETSPFNYILVDTFRTRLRVNAVSFFEDPARPESWLRDLRFESWDPRREAWVFSKELRADAAVHTHRLDTPVEGARFRIVLPWGVCGNVRLAELVFHGEERGGSHPDVVDKRPVAVLFDEGDDLKNGLVDNYQGLTFRFEGAFSGGRCLFLPRDRSAVPLWQPPFGHVLPNWDFEVVEKPGPGQYRHLEFAWRALSAGARGLALRIDGDGYGHSATFAAGEAKPEDGATLRKVAEAPPREWSTVRVDLWEVFKKPVRVRGLRLSAIGGDGAFDRILLARSPADFP
jgi:outer membrane protein assembly factor BamB